MNKGENPARGENPSPFPSRLTEDDLSNPSSPSPTDTRTPPTRYGSITPQQEDASIAGSFQSSDTIRRRPPEQLLGYGTIPTPRLEQRFSETSSSFNDQTRGTESSHLQQQTPSPSVDTDKTRGSQKKPTFLRRASSNVKGPHRGQSFSVDDNVNEYPGKLSRQVSQASYGTGRLQQPSIKRRQTTQQPSLPRVDSLEDEEEAENRSLRTGTMQENADGADDGNDGLSSAEEGTIRGGNDVAIGDDNEDDEGNLSESNEDFTLKDRQEAINETHPFGIRIWKSALYKKDRSVQKNAEGDIHSSPGGNVSPCLLLFNVLWTVCFGWWLALVAFVGAIFCFMAAAPSAREYGHVLYGLAGYLWYPFGKFVRLDKDEAYAEEDEGEGRPIAEYEQWQSGDLEDGRLFFSSNEGEGSYNSHSRSIVGRSRSSIDSGVSETTSLLGRTRRGMHRADSSPRPKRRFFGRGQWTAGRVIFFLFFWGLISPSLLLVSAICWGLVFTIPMGKVTRLLFYHLRRHPLALSFQADTTYSRGSSDSNSSILLCTYRAVGSKYWKYTIDGTNIFLINLMSVVFFVIFDYWVLAEWMELSIFITHPAFLFIGALFSIIPLAYFIGQAVASISAQSSMGVGAAINAFFSTLVEVFLYCVALNEGKGQLVEGSIIGSIFAGILVLPGLSMLFGATKRKTQRFNAKSAGVTSTMLLFAMIPTFCPTLFYQIWGTSEMHCTPCDGRKDAAPSLDCKRCSFAPLLGLDDRFYLEIVRPFCWFAASVMFLSYVIGLLFTLRTHAALIWNTEPDEKKHLFEHHMGASGIHPPGDGDVLSHSHKHVSHQLSRQEMAPGAEIRDSQLYKRILSQLLKQIGLSAKAEEHSSRYGSLSTVVGGNCSAQTPHLVPPKSAGADSMRSDVEIPGYTDEQNNNLVRQFAEITASAVAVAARDSARANRKVSTRPQATRNVTATAGNESDAVVVAEASAGAAGGGHDAPNWSRLKSSIILCGATVLYAMIAEILVNTVDVVLGEGAVSEKFLGMTLFALVPNTTEFLNAISFAMNGNIALSMEIGSAYTLQVCLLQIPALVFYTAVNGPLLDGSVTNLADFTFSLIFPQFDMVTVIFGIFLLNYVHGEGKSNYFKGSILLLTYLTFMVGFWLSSNLVTQNMGMSRFDILQAGGLYKTIGRSTSGEVFPALR